MGLREGKGVAEDAKTVKSFPITEHYDVGETLTSLGIGEALVTVLSPEGVPTPLAATRLVPPDSLMDAVDDATRAQLIAAGSLQAANVSVSRSVISAPSTSLVALRPVR